MVFHSRMFPHQKVYIIYAQVYSRGRGESQFMDADMGNDLMRENEPHTKVYISG